MRKIALVLILFAFISLVGKSWHWAKDGFSISRVRKAFPEKNEDSSINIQSAFGQPYRYLSRGHQCYAFISEDGKYVLKLPRLDRYEIPFWLRSCRFPFFNRYREELLADREHRFDFLIESFEIAYSDLKAETAVLYVHMNRTSHLKTKLVIKDRLRRSYRLDLDAMPFVLQEREPLMMPLFEQCLKDGDRKGAEEILEAFLQVVAARARKGIYNKDPSFLRNFGLDGKRGIQIDIGSFYRKPEGTFEKSFRETVSHVHNWLIEIDPEILTWFDARVEQLIREK